MPRRNEKLLAELYEKFGKGDLPGVLAMCDDGTVFEVPGAAPFSGTYTKQTFPDLIGQVMQISGGTFGEKPVDIIANDEHGVAILEHWLERDGKRIEYRTDHIWRIRDGKFTGWFERPGNLDEFNRAWS